MLKTIASIPPAKKRILLFSAAAVLLAACLALLLLRPKSSPTKPIVQHPMSEKVYRAKLVQATIDLYDKYCACGGITDALEDDIDMKVISGDWIGMLQETGINGNWWLSDRNNCGLQDIIKAHKKIEAEMQALQSRKGYEETYCQLQKLYACYTTAYQQVTEPHGPWGQYVYVITDTANADNDAFAKLEKLLPEVKKKLMG